MSEKETITTYLARRAEEVNKALDQLLPTDESPPEKLHQAMRYSLFAGGKRLRPALVLATGEALGAATEDLMPAACAIEMIHTYSLIHDDLPAMDNDDLRRGRPTCHKAFGEAVAILAGDALLTLAFRVLARDLSLRNPERQLLVIEEVARSAGSWYGMIAGQIFDIENEGRQVDLRTLQQIHHSKTGEMIGASVAVGGIIAGASNDIIVRLRAYGKKIGLAFQIADDILDVTSTSEQLGKTPGKDQAANKATYPALIGLEASEAKAENLIDEAVELASGLGVDARVLEDLARFIIARKS